MLSPRRLLVVFGLLVVSASAASQGGIRAGAFASDITPRTLPSPINGGMKGAFSSAVTDPMHARALALQDGATEIIFCVVDACMIPREVCEAAKVIAAKATGVPASHLLISATHSHSCATMVGVFQSDPDPAYVSSLPPRIAEALIKAHANLEPAEIAWGKDRDPSQVFNRRWFVKPEQTYENPFDGTADRALMNPGYQSPRVSAPGRPGRSRGEHPRRACAVGWAPARRPRQLQSSLRRRIAGNFSGLLWCVRR